MHGAFGTVVVVVCVLAAVIALGALLASRRSWQEYGRRGLTFDSDRSELDDPIGAARTEIRELIEAQNARRARRGEPPLDVEDELERLSRTEGPAWSKRGGADRPSESR